MHKQFGGVYIMGNNRPTLYTGMTNNLFRRIKEHKQLKHGFTKKYNLDLCLYYEFISDMHLAIIREKQIKNLNRQQKLDLIKQTNPLMVDISSQLFALIDEPNNIPLAKLYQTLDKPE